MSIEFFHYGTIVLSVMLPAISVGIAEGIASLAAIRAIDIQPSAKSEIMRLAIIGMAIIETAAIMGVSMAIVLWLSQPNYYASIAELGIAAAIGLSGFFIGLVSALPTYAACFSVARQPFFAQKILRFMLVTQSLIQTPVIFGFIIAMLIKNQAATITTLPQALMLVACGLSIGLGCIGPAIGMALFAKQACQGIGVNRDAYSKLFTFSIISQAIIETPIIFALVISMLIFTMSNSMGDNPMLMSIACLSSALCIGIGTLGPGIGSGRVAAAACEQIVAHPQLQGTLSRLSLFGQMLIDTCAIYCLLISIMLLVWK